MFGLIPVKKGTITKGDSFWDINRMIDDFFNDSFFRRFGSVGSPIRADIRETDKEYIIDAEIPGVDKKDIKVDFTDDVLTIEVEQKEEINEEKGNYIHRERRVGSFKRSFYVEDVKDEDIKADYKNGVLTIVLPKENVQKTKSRKIEIQ